MHFSVSSRVFKKSIWKSGMLLLGLSLCSTPLWAQSPSSTHSSSSSSHPEALNKKALNKKMNQWMPALTVAIENPPAAEKLYAFWNTWSARLKPILKSNAQLKYPFQMVYHQQAQNLAINVNLTVAGCKAMLHYWANHPQKLKTIGLAHNAQPLSHWPDKKKDLQSQLNKVCQPRSSDNLNLWSLSKKTPPPSSSKWSNQ